jgi:hypothetical protein
MPARNPRHELRIGGETIPHHPSLSLYCASASSERTFTPKQIDAASAAHDAKRMRIAYRVPSATLSANVALKPTSPDESEISSLIKSLVDAIAGGMLGAAGSVKSSLACSRR